MDIQRQISKAHKALIASLEPEEFSIFNQLTVEHQFFIISFLVGRDENIFPEDESIEDAINDDIESCIQHIKENLLKIITDSEAIEEWNGWLSLKQQVRDIMEIQSIARLLFIPYDIKLSHEKRVVMHETASGILAEFWATEDYITPYLYPWQTAYKNILFKEQEIPDFSVSGDRGRRMFFSELPLDKKIYACIHINDLEQASKIIPKGGRLHLEKIFQVWRSYLPISDMAANQKMGKAVDTPSYFVDCGGKYAELFRDADQAYRESFAKHPTAVALFDNLPVLCPHLVKGVDGDSSKREARKLIFVGGDYLSWKSFLKAFKRYFPALSN